MLDIDEDWKVFDQHDAGAIPDIRMFTPDGKEVGERIIKVLPAEVVHKILSDGLKAAKD